MLRAVTREEIIDDLEDIISDIKSGKYPSVIMSSTLVLTERSISYHISETYQSGKQISLVLNRESINNGN